MGRMTFSMASAPMSYMRRGSKRGFAGRAWYLMTKTGATRTLDNARDRLEIDLPVHPLELSDGIAWEHRHMSERRNLRLDMAGKDTTPLIWKFGYDDVRRILAGNDDFDTLASLELDPDGVGLPNGKIEERKEETEE